MGVSEARLRVEVPGALCDIGPKGLRAPVWLRPGDRDDQLGELKVMLDRFARDERLAGGLRDPRCGLARDAKSVIEATTAAAIVRAIAPQGGARACSELGAYRYLTRHPEHPAPDERHAEAIRTLLDYDERRRTDLILTLERYLGDRAGVASTARSLSIHHNTLRQRLERIEELTGLALEKEDLLSLELALKLARLQGGRLTPRGSCAPVRPSPRPPLRTARGAEATGSIFTAPECLLQQVRRPRPRPSEQF